MSPKAATGCTAQAVERATWLQSVPTSHLMQPSGGLILGGHAAAACEAVEGIAGQCGRRHAQQLHAREQLREGGAAQKSCAHGTERAIAQDGVVME